MQIHALAVLLFVLICIHEVAGGDSLVGVSYGTLGDDLLSPVETLRLIRSCGIPKFRLYDPHPDVMAALTDSDTARITIGVLNQDLAQIGDSPDAAKAWVGANIASYPGGTRLIADVIAGNEVIPGDIARHVVPAIRNLQAALDEAGLGDILVTTAIHAGAMENTYPPSHSTFTSDASGVMSDLVRYLLDLPQDKRPPLYVHVYPYFAYASDPENVPLDFALFQSQSPVFTDGTLEYRSLYDAMYDAFVWAMEKIGGGDVVLDVGETGWPSGGNGDRTTRELASSYTTNMYDHVVGGAGTPKRPNAATNVYVFAMFNENQKPPGVEQNFGLFFPDGRQVYSTPLCPS